jgi:gamma-glutamylcyclotransferase (GGCT)/AIG2-like uncharacterized protein YtfP
MKMEQIAKRFRKATRSSETFQKEEAVKAAESVKTEYNALIREAESVYAVVYRADAFNRDGARRAAERLDTLRKEIGEFREKHNIQEPLPEALSYYKSKEGV